MAGGPAADGVLPVVLAGGVGARLWPLSRELHPKPFAALAGERTMLQHVLERLAGLVGAEPPVIVCNENHRFIAAEQCRRAGVMPGAILLEPAPRNTAPAAALAALGAVAAGGDPLLLVLPADNLIASAEGFLDAVDRGAALARAGRLALFGIEPTRPDPNYGYILPGPPVADRAMEVAAFVEKPPLVEAERRFASGRFYWNSGIFLFRASVWLDELRRFRPDILAACEAAASDESADLDLFRRPGPAFRDCPAESIDRAVMERTGRAAVVPARMGWADLGSWDALAEAGPRDADDNLLRGDVIAVESRASCLVAESRLVAALGLEGMVVVETADAVLVAARSRAAEVGRVVERLRREGRAEHFRHEQTWRPWGSGRVVDRGPGFLVKRLRVDPGAALSLQSHRHRAEHWVVTAGAAEVERGGERFTLAAGESTWIAAGVRHRLANPGPDVLQLVEVQVGDPLSEDDIERFEDRYGRA